MKFTASLPRHISNNNNNNPATFQTTTTTTTTTIYDWLIEWFSNDLISISVISLQQLVYA